MMELSKQIAKSAANVGRVVSGVYHVNLWLLMLNSVMGSVIFVVKL